jgi:hypothetical protein
LRPRGLDSALVGRVRNTDRDPRQLVLVDGRTARLPGRAQRGAGDAAVEVGGGAVRGVPVGGRGGLEDIVRDRQPGEDPAGEGEDRARQRGAMEAIGERGRILVVSGRATLTTVASRKAMLEPSTVTPRTQRPAGLV